MTEPRQVLTRALRELATRVLALDVVHLAPDDTELLSEAEAGAPLDQSQIRRVLALGRQIVEGSDEMERAA